MGLEFPEMLLISVMAILLVLPASRICAKAGYPAWLGGLAILPVVNVALAFFLAFSTWPIEKRLETSSQRNV